MKKFLIWDMPLRIFHWLFAACILGALIIALAVNDESRFFNLHMLLGLSSGMLLLIRIFIALFGAKYSKLSGLLFSPIETFRYFSNAFSLSAKKYFGHNPGTAAAAIIMFVLITGLITTGLTINSEFSESIHPLLAYAFIAVIALHLLGLIVHSFIYKENISASIITGKKQVPMEAAIKSPQTAAGLLSLVIIGGWFVMLFNSYSPESSSIKIPFSNNVLILGEEEDKIGSENEEQEHVEDED